MNYNLSTLPIPLPHDALTPANLLTFTDNYLTSALSLPPTAISNPSSASHSSFLETAVGIATLVLSRSMESGSSRSPFDNSWPACAQLLMSVTQMAISEDINRHKDDDDGCEVLYGRAGLLYALLRLRSVARRCNVHSNDLKTTVETLSSDDIVRSLVESIIVRGKSGAAVYAAEILHGRQLAVPALMWSWHGIRYLGAAHGVGMSIRSALPPYASQIHGLFQPAYSRSC